MRLLLAGLRMSIWSILRVLLRLGLVRLVVELVVVVVVVVVSGLKYSIAIGYLHFRVFLCLFYAFVFIALYPTQITI